MDVQGQLESIISRFQGILKTNLIGIYLHGSLASGCFNPQRSDIDLLILTRRTLTPRNRCALARTLLTLSRSPAPIELSVIRCADLHPWKHPCPYDFHFSEHWRSDFECFLADPAFPWLAPENGDSDLAGHITFLQARGKALSGAPIDEVFPEIPRADFIDSILSDVFDPKFGIESETVPPVYMVLNACRTLAYLKTGKILSKAEGGVWAFENIPVEYRRIVTTALNAYQTAANDQALASVDLRSFRAWDREEICQACETICKTNA